MKGVLEDDVIYQFKNCQLLMNSKIVNDDLYIRNGKILNSEKLFFDERVSSDVQIDCQNCYICPGFIDLQINGAFGIDFSLPSVDIVNGLDTVAKGLLAHGVTSFCPTIVTSSTEVYKKALPACYKRDGSAKGAGILGAHIEGPFISKEKKGAHKLEHIRSFNNGIKDIDNIYGDLSQVSIVTLAPELANSTEVIKYLTSKGITVSLGHSTANLQQGESAVNAGASFITHLFNAMYPFHHRDPHLVGLLASDKVPMERTVFYGMIADGIHTHAAALRIAFRTHPKGIVLVTDAVPAMGLPTGTHHIGELNVEIRQNSAYIAGTNTLCGSTTSMNECVKYFFENTGCSVVDVLESATLHPAQVLGITDRKGTLNHGTDADFVLLDNKLNLKQTYIGGQCVWAEKSSAQTL